MTDADHDRRRFLAYAGTGVAAVVGGCLGTNANTTTTATQTATDATDTATETPTDTATDTEISDDEAPQHPPMSTVFHFSSTPDEQDHAVANVTNLLADDTTDLDDVALVANGIGLELLVDGDSTIPDDVRSLIDDDVTFYACQNSMNALDVDESDLLSDEIEVVPAGVGKLTELQAKDGYAYIKTP